MLPHSYGTLVAIALMLGGAVACFAGYRWFRIVLAIDGFVLGATLSSSVMASGNAFGMVLAALVGGVVGAIVLFFAYFVGIALVGAGLGTLLIHVGWAQYKTGDPPAVIVLVFAILGTVTALVLQRYVIIVATSFSGAWTILIGALTLMGGRVPRVSSSDVWIFYPFTPAPGVKWVPISWIALGLIGTVVQLGLTGKKLKR